MPNETKIDVGDNDEDPTEVNISPQEDNEEAPLAVSPDVVEEDDSSGELEQYSAGVQGRISQLTKRFREEERQKQTAIEFAENVRTENERLKQRITALDEGYMAQFDGRVSSELDSAKQSLREAHETGDVDKLVQAQEDLANLTVQKSHADVARTKKVQRVESETPAPPPLPPQPTQPQPQATPDPKAEAWAAENTWFGNDEVMTYGAFGIHRRLVEDEGFDPTSDAYYAELDSRLRNEFPNKLDSKSKTNGGRKVASAESSASRKRTGRKTVRLTPSQVAIAKKLNVPLEEYAKYVRD
jgi:hypothetical protein|tara:strand:+ start:547 stop:1443 length:897 start_codon:yes stop_codon:yes gene_type:complete